MDQYEQANEYQKLALESAQKLNIRSLFWKIYNNIGVINYYQGDYYESIFNFKKAEEYVSIEKIPAKHGLLYNNLGELYRLVGSYDLSSDYHRKAIKLFHNIDDTTKYVHTTFLLVETLLEQKKFNEAENLLSSIPKIFDLSAHLNFSGKLNKLLGYIESKLQQTFQRYFSL